MSQTLTNTGPTTPTAVETAVAALQILPYGRSTVNTLQGKEYIHISCPCKQCTWYSTIVIAPASIRKCGNHRILHPYVMTTVRLFWEYCITHSDSTFSQILNSFLKTLQRRFKHDKSAIRDTCSIVRGNLHASSNASTSAAKPAGENTAWIWLLASTCEKWHEHRAIQSDEGEPPLTHRVWSYTKARRNGQRSQGYARICAKGTWNKICRIHATK